MLGATPPIGRSGGIAEREDRVAITSSVIQNDAPQADGRRRVTEAHPDHLGVVHSRTYLADAETDVVTALAPRASQLVAELADAEFARNLTQILARQTTGLTTQHLTLAQLGNGCGLFIRRQIVSKCVCLRLFS